MPDARQKILAAVRRNQPSPVELPARDGEWTRYDDPLEQFRETLEAVGGMARRVADEHEADLELRELAQYKSAESICSLVPGVGSSNVKLEEIDDPHGLENVDFAILPGQFAVAENAAVWVTDGNLEHRVLPFICQHLALVVASSEMVHNLHEAYDRLSSSEGGHPLGVPGFGVFISGPSKTADIEQSLVIGAHGARSLTVFLMG